MNILDLNGYDFCKRIESNEKFKDIYIYYLIGVPSSEISMKTLETKANGFITKPFELGNFNDIFKYLSSQKS